MRTIKTNWMKLGVHGVANVLLWYCQEIMGGTYGVPAIFYYVWR